MRLGTRLNSSSEMGDNDNEHEITMWLRGRRERRKTKGRRKRKRKTKEEGKIITRLNKTKRVSDCALGIRGKLRPAKYAQGEAKGEVRCLIGRFCRR
jgi:hypothetical protein